MTWRTLGVYGSAVAAAVLAGLAVFSLTGSRAWGVWSGEVMAALIVTAFALFRPGLRRWLGLAAPETLFTFPYLIRRARLADLGGRISLPLIMAGVIIGNFPDTALIAPDVRLAVGLALSGAGVLIVAGFVTAGYLTARRPAG